MNHPKYTYLAVDISKSGLELLIEGKSMQVPRTTDGFKKILSVCSQFDQPLVVFEATGGYERPLWEYLQLQGIPMAIVSPARVRAFAKSEGIRAKSDPIDTRMILRFAQEKRVMPMRLREEKRIALADLMDRRAHLCEQLTREKTRLQKAPRRICPSIERMIKCIGKELERIEAEIEALIASDKALTQEAEEIQKIKGLGKVNAWTLMAYLGEMQHLKRNQLVALAGLAPFNRDSGNKTGKRFISGGRAKVRKALYMAATCAAVHNPVIKPYVERLKTKGKPHKCAMVAAMRKLLLHVQSQLKNRPIAA